MFEGISTKKLNKTYGWLLNPNRKKLPGKKEDGDNACYYFVVRYKNNPDPPSEKEICANGMKTNNFLELVQAALIEFERNRLSDFIIETVQRGILLPSIHYIPGDHEGNCRSAYEYFNGQEFGETNTEYFFGFDARDTDQ